MLDRAPRTDRPSRPANPSRDDRHPPPLAPRAVAAAGWGLALALSFPPYSLWPLMPVAVAGFTLTIRGGTARRGALLGLVFGLASLLVVLDWMRVIGVDAWLLLGLLEAGFVAALGAGLALVTRLPGWPVWTAALWVGEELLRSRLPLGGLPWARLAFGQTDTPLTPYAALGGAPLVTFVTALVAGLLAWALLQLRTRRTIAALGVGVAALLPLAAYAVPQPTDGDDYATVAVVQGNVPRSGLDFEGQREAVLRNHVRETRLLAQRVRAGEVPRPDLVLWPENSSDIDPYTDPSARALIDDSVGDVGVPTLVGAVVDGPDARHVSNTGIVWDPTSGPGETYVKRHPVPFGEYIPFRSALTRFISRLDRIPRDFYAASRPGVLDVGPARLGDVICFEVAYDDLVRDVVTGGGRAIVVQTNNATYGRTGQPEQQLAMSRLRAVEHGRSVLVAATSGISAIVAPDGRVVQRSAEFTPASLVARVPLRDGRTAADRLGAGPEWALAIVGVVAVAGAVRRRRRGDEPEEGGG